MSWYAVIDPESPRHAHWISVLGTDVMEVESPEPIVGFDETTAIHRPFFKARVSRLTHQQIGHMATMLSEVWQLPVLEVLAEIHGEHGVPILADDVRIIEGPDYGPGRRTVGARELSSVLSPQS